MSQLKQNPSTNESFEYTHCAVCKKDDFDLLSQKGQFELPTYVGICRNCGLAYLNPRWNKDRYQHFYEQEYDKFYRPQEISENAYQFDIPTNMVERIGLKDQMPQNPEHILDIGSGRGDALMYLKSQVWTEAQYFAIEPSENARKHLSSKGVEVITSDADNQWHIGLEGKFDLVIMRHVLEHFLDPLSILDKVRQVLKPTGIFYVVVPNAAKPKLPIVKHYFRVVHTYYFTQHSLNNVLQMCGLTPVCIDEGDTFGPYELFAIAHKAPTKIPPEVSPKAYNTLKSIYTKALRQDRKLMNKLKFKAQHLLTTLRNRTK